MSNFLTLTCPSCGGSLTITDDIDRFVCMHCGIEHIVKRDNGLVMFYPILNSMSKGVDNTSSELALNRLEREISNIEYQLSKIQAKESCRETLHLFGIMGLIFSTLFLAISLCSGVGGVFGGIIGMIISGVCLLPFESFKGLDEEEDRLLEILSDLQTQWKYHYNKVRFRY